MEETVEEIQMSMVPIVPINQGGLLRCCIESLGDDIQIEEGSLHKCKSCGTYIKIINGAWTWAQMEREDFGGKK